MHERGEVGLMLSIKLRRAQIWYDTRVCQGTYRSEMVHVNPRFHKLQYCAFPGDVILVTSATSTVCDHEFTSLWIMTMTEILGVNLNEYLLWLVRLIGPCHYHISFWSCPYRFRSYISTGEALI